ncbi:MAG: EAL domain-containing protein [Betaproteobacteria bacterium]
MTTLAPPATLPDGFAPPAALFDWLDLLEQAGLAGSWQWLPDAPEAVGTLNWTPALARLLQWGAAEMPPWRHPADLLAPECRADLQAALQGAAEADTLVLETLALSAQGRKLPVRLLLRWRSSATGRLWQGVLQDRSDHRLHEQQSRRERMQLSTTLASMTEAFATLAPDGRLSYLNPPACRLLDRQPWQLLGRRLWHELDERSGTALRLQVQQALDSAQGSEFEVYAQSLDKWLELRLYPFDEGLALYITDVSQRHRTQEQLLLLRTCIARLNDVVYITEQPAGQPLRIVFVNEAFSRLTGYSAQEVQGQHPRLLRGPLTQASELARIAKALRRQQAVRSELIHYRKDGQTFWLELELVPVGESDRGSAHWVAVGRDITARKAQEDVIEHLAFHDPLTGLPNRQLLLVRLQNALSETAAGARIGALLFIDLDHFKLLNDTLGHDRGDELLQQVAARLKACVRESDTVARLGGDEFVVVMQELAERPAAASERARQAATLILRTLGQPYELAGQTYHGTCSIGITLLSDHEHTLADLLKQADLAMYQAKAVGRNSLCFFDPHMQATALAKAALSSALRQALHEQQFVLHYQPQVQADGQVIGLEALLRWRQPTGELRGPSSFIAQAEESGLILPLGQWVLDQACHQLALWSEHRLLRSLSLSVNVSTRQFLQPSFVEQVLHTVARHGVRAQQIELEITESLLATDLEGTIARMRRLHQAGLRLAIDDFGMGYSALSYLKHMPLQRLKIDRSFVIDMLDDPRDAAIARTIVHLAHDLGMQVTAEGVETQAQLQLLADAGCQAFQGFLFSPALPAEQIEAFVTERALAALSPG